MASTTENFALSLHEGTDKPGAAFRQDNGNMAVIDAALDELAGQIEAAGMPVGSVLWMTTQTNPATAGAPGTWAYLFPVNLALTTGKLFYLYERTA